MDAVVTATEGFEASPVTHINAAVLQVGQLPDVTVVKTRDVPTVSSGGLVVYTMTSTSNGPGPAEDVVVLVDIDPSISFGLISQGGQAFTFTDTGSPALPSNFYGTPEYSLNGGPFGAAPATPPDYNPDITTVRIPMNGDMQTGSQFTLVYEGEAK